MNIQSGFSFKFLVQYRSMKIKGKNIEVDLQVGLVKVIKSTSSCPDLGQSLNQRAVSPTASAYIMSTRTKVYHYRIQYTYTRVRSPKALQRWDASLPAADPFFHDVGANFRSCTSPSPTVYRSRSLLTSGHPLDLALKDPRLFTHWGW
jgi:hypothetical protein